MEVQGWCDTCRKLRIENATLAAENEELRRWKTEQLEVESSWNVQSVGKLINCPPGVNIRPRIEDFIRHCIAENSALKSKLTEWEESAAWAWKTPCADEKHCSCVPLLRAKLDRVEADIIGTREKGKP
jgi:hypothetical protein